MIFNGDKEIKTENYADKHWNNEECNVVIEKNSEFIKGGWKKIGESIKALRKSLLDRIRELFCR